MKKAIKKQIRIKINFQIFQKAITLTKNNFKKIIKKDLGYKKYLNKFFIIIIYLIF